MSLSVPLTHQLLWLVIPVALCGVVVIAKQPIMEIRLVAGHMVYTNPEYLGPGSFLRVSRMSRKSHPVLNAFFPMIKDLPPNTNISWACFQKVNNAWTPTMIKGSMALCSMLESKNELQRLLFESGNFPKKCPLRKGNYTVKDFFIKTDKLPPMIPGSDWKAYSRWAVADANLMVYDFEVKITRKDGGHGGSETALAYAILG